MIFYSLLAIVLLSPLPFGSNTAWAWSLFSLLTGVLIIVWSVLRLFKKQSVPFFSHINTISDVVIVFLILIGWIVIQASGSFLPSLNHPLWQLANEAGVLSPDFISLTPADTITSLMRMLSYVLIFWLSLCYSQDVDKARQVFYSLMVMGFVYSAYALLIYLGDFKMVVWREKTHYLNDLTGTFINRNHFATFAGLTLVCTLALVHEGLCFSSKYNIGGNLGWQRFIENLIIRTWLPLLVFAVISTALILTHSRAGFFSSLTGLVVLLIALNANRHSRNFYMLWLFSAFIVLGGFVFYLSGEGLLARLDAQGLTDSGREEVYQLTGAAILTNPWLGFGLGSFAEVFPLYKSLNIASAVTHPSLWDYAHNTYLEIIFELGIPASLALFYCFARLVWICCRGLFIRKRDWIYPAVGLSATCLIAAHALVDFSMQIPAVAYIYVLLMGAACGQSFATKKL
jgi:O-antigen ligase